MQNIADYGGCANYQLKLIYFSLLLIYVLKSQRDLSKFKIINFKMLILNN